MVIQGVDYSDGRPTGKALAAAGIQFAVRYLRYRGITDPAKPLSLVELADLHGHGISVVANFESTADRALDGSVAGVSDAHDALAAVRGLGFPEACPVYFSVDFAPQARYFPVIDSYFAGILTVLPLARVGAYGGGDLLRHLAAKRLASWFWNAASTSWGKLYTGSHIWQYQTGSMGARPINGASVDYNRALRPDYGQFEAPGSAGSAQGVSDVIFSRGGLKTALVKAGTPFAIEPAGPTAGHFGADTRVLIVAFDKSGHWCAVDGNYLQPQSTTTVQMGWITTDKIGDLQDAIPAVHPPDCNQAIQDAITADRSQAYVAYRSQP